MTILTSTQLIALSRAFRGGFVRIHGSHIDFEAHSRLVDRGLLRAADQEMGWFEFRLTPLGRKRVKQALGTAGKR